MGNEKRIEFAAKALIMQGGKFLAMHKTHMPQGVWELPGGRMEFGETAEQTVAREVWEETGLRVRPVRLLDTWNLVREEWQITGVIFVCAVDGDGGVRLSTEHDKFEWWVPGGAAFGQMGLFGARMVTWDWAGLG